MKAVLTIFFFIPIILFSQNSNDDLYKGIEGRKVSKGSSNSDFSIELSPILLIPNSYNIRDTYKNGIGGIITLNKSLNTKSSIFLESGLVNFKGNPMRISSQMTLTAPSYTLIPINLGLRYNLEKIFFGLGAGIGLTDLKDSDFGVNRRFMINPMIGYDFNKFKISVNYAFIDTDLNANKFLGLKFSMKLIKLKNASVNY